MKSSRIAPLGSRHSGDSVDPAVYLALGRARQPAGRQAFSWAGVPRQNQKSCLGKRKFKHAPPGFLGASMASRWCYRGAIRFVIHCVDVRGAARKQLLERTINTGDCAVLLIGVDWHAALRPALKAGEITGPLSPPGEV